MPVNLIPVLIKYGVPFILVAALLGYGAYEVHENGKQVERVAWQAKALDEAEAAEIARISADELTASIAREHRKQLEEITNVKKKAIDTLNSDIAALSDRGLYIPASACPDTKAGETTDTSGTSGPPGRIRLPEKIAEDLIWLAEDAQRVVIQYEGCRTELKDLADVLPSAVPDGRSR